MTPLDAPTFFTKLLEETFANIIGQDKAEITDNHKARFSKIGQWLSGERCNGWMFLGNPGSGKTALLESLRDILRGEDYIKYRVMEQTILGKPDNKNYETYQSAHRQYTEYLNSVKSKTMFTTSRDICRLANIKGRDALFVGDNAPGNIPVLIIDDLGDATEQESVTFHGKTDEGYFLTEQIFPIIELIEHRYENNNGILILSSNLDMDKISKKYGPRIGDPTNGRLAAMCYKGIWEFNGYRSNYTQNLKSNVTRHRTVYDSLI